MKPTILVATRQKETKVAVYAAIITFCTYASVYAFRKPFAVATYTGMPAVFGLAYKDVLIICQVLGYMCSKFYGIRFVAEMGKHGRGRKIFLLILFSWLALLLFALVPAPFNIVFLFLNGFPLGIIWGIVFSYVEGRKATDFIGATLAVSFIFSSGFVKSVAKWLMIHLHITDLWLPFATGLVFVLPLVLFIYLLEKIPEPSLSDTVARAARLPMNQAERRAFFQRFKTGLITLIIVYVFLTIFRDIRDNFAADIWNELGFGSQPSVFTATEIPISISVLLMMALMMLVKNNMKAFKITHLILIAGFLVAGGSSFLFLHQLIGPFAWMTLCGLGLYMGYIPFNCILFERLIASFRYAANVGFLMYLADSFGYLGSVAVILGKTMFSAKLQWSVLYSQGVVWFSVAGIFLTAFSMRYFIGKEVTGIGAAEVPVFARQAKERSNLDEK